MLIEVEIIHVNVMLKQEEVETEDNFAVGNLIKGTALRELGRLDAASECLERIRYTDVSRIK